MSHLQLALAIAAAMTPLDSAIPIHIPLEDQCATAHFESLPDCVAPMPSDRVVSPPIVWRSALDGRTGPFTRKKQFGDRGETPELYVAHAPQEAMAPLAGRIPFPYHWRTLCPNVHDE